MGGPRGGDNRVHAGDPQYFRRIHWLAAWLLGTPRKSGAGNPLTIPSLPLHHLGHSQPRPGPSTPRAPLGIFLRSPSRRGTENSLFFLFFFHRPQLPMALALVVATRIFDGHLCMPPPSSPGDVSVSQWAGLGNRGERMWGGGRNRPLDRDFLRLTGRSAGRPACNSIGSRTPNTHFQL